MRLSASRLDDGSSLDLEAFEAELDHHKKSEVLGQIIMNKQ